MSEEPGFLSEQPRIEPGSLAEHLFVHHGLKDLERLLADGYLEPLKQQWSLSDEQCQQQIELAVHYIRQD